MKINLIFIYMRYLGGKKRIGKEISEVLKKHAPPGTVKGYIEPFCGALGVMIHMVNDYKVCKAYDICEDIILLWNEIKNGTFKYPKKVSEETYLRYKKSTIPSSKRAFIGFGCSFAAAWFTGYSPKYSYANRDTVKECTLAIKKMRENIKKIGKIECKSYLELNPKGYLIYCDPPYSDCQGYNANTQKFDNSLFWETVRKWSKHNVVIVSEFTAPSDFKCIWKKDRMISTNKKYAIKKIEKLFIKMPC